MEFQLYTDNNKFINKVCYEKQRSERGESQV